MTLQELKKLRDEATPGKWECLDDDSDILTEQMPNFFQTSWDEGLTKAIADRVIQHLNKS